MSDVRAECRERYGDGPCSVIWKRDADGIRLVVHDTHECNDWCPLLQRKIEDAGDEDLIDDARTD